MELLDALPDLNIVSNAMATKPENLSERAPEKRNKSGHKTVIFEPALEDRVQEVADKTRSSFSATCLDLIETGLETKLLSPGTELVRMGDLPPWIALCIREISRLTGVSNSGAVINILNENVRDYMEQAKAKSEEVNTPPRSAAKGKA